MENFNHLTDTQKSQIIDAVKARPYLYDKAAPGYLDRSMKLRAYTEIGAMFDMEGPSVSKLWQGLRGQYSRELNKVTASGSSGGRKKKWPFFDQLGFLEKFMAKRETLSNMTDEQADIADTQPGFDQEDAPADADGGGGETGTDDVSGVEEATSPGSGGGTGGAVQAGLGGGAGGVGGGAGSTPRPTPATTPTTTHAKEPRRAEKRKAKGSGPTGEVAEIDKLILAELKHGNDEDATFGETVAMSLRKLEPYIKAQVKYQVTQILYQAEMRQLAATASAGLQAPPLTPASGFQAPPPPSSPGLQALPPTPAPNLVGHAAGQADSGRQAQGPGQVSPAGLDPPMGQVPAQGLAIPHVFYDSRSGSSFAAL